jgi:hypothetical protein
MFDAALLRITKAKHRLDQGPHGLSRARPIGQLRDDSHTGNAIVSSPRLALEGSASTRAMKICAHTGCLI